MVFQIYQTMNDQGNNIQKRVVGPFEKLIVCCFNVTLYPDIDQ